MLWLLLCNELKSAIPPKGDITAERNSLYSLVALASQQPTEVKNVSLKRVEDTAHIAYVSAIALQQAASQHNIAMPLATQLVENLCQARSERQAISTFADINLESFSIRAIPPGLIRFELSDRGIATIFQQLLYSPGQFRQLIHPSLLVNKQVTRLSLSLPEPAGCIIFRAQHIHARCCSLLRLANQQGMITLVLPAHFGERQFLLPDPVPWLKPVDDRGSSLRLQHPAEWLLINRIFWILDELCLPAATSHSSDLPVSLSAKWLQHFDRLNQAFHAFHRDCRIFGLSREDVSLAQTRLGLVQVVQWLLQFTLEERFGIAAPIEL